MNVSFLNRMHLTWCLKNISAAACKFVTVCKFSLHRLAQEVDLVPRPLPPTGLSRTSTLRLSNYSMTVVQKEAVRAKLKHLKAVGEESASHRESKHDVMERRHALMLPGPPGTWE